MRKSEDLFELPRVEIRDEGLRVFLNPDEIVFFHYFWLRSACRCSDCGDTATGKRRLLPSDVPLDPKPRSAVIEDARLVIVWSTDDHCSRYDLDWLREHSHGAGLPTWQPTLWDAELQPESIAHDYLDVKGDPAARLDFMRCLRDYGIALVRNSGQCGIEAMAALIGDIAGAAYDPVFELRPNPDQQTYGNSTAFVPPHTDESYLHTPTGMLVLYCVNPANDGGESILVDGFSAAYQLRDRDPAAFDILSRVPQPNHRVVPGENRDLRTRARVLSIDENGALTGLRFHTRALAPIDVGGELARDLHRANHGLCKRILDPANQLCYPLEAGEAMFFDNHRVLHSRRAFTDLQRHLQICNVSREQFHQSLRLLARDLGFRDEARQFLPAGVCG